MAFGIGFTAGAVGAATGGAALSVAGGAGMGGFFGGAFSGAVGATNSTVTLGIANNVYFGDPLPSNGDFLTTVFTSALTAGLINGDAVFLCAFHLPAIPSASGPQSTPLLCKVLIPQPLQGKRRRLSSGAATGWLSHTPFVTGLGRRYLADTVP